MRGTKHIMQHVYVAGIGLLFAWLEFVPLVILGTMVLLAISFVLGDISKQGERLTAILREHSEPQLDRIENGHVELVNAVEQLRRELATVGHQVRELVAVRAALPGKPKGPWEA